MKMSKNYKKICLALALTGVIGAGTVTAKSGNQSVTATYRNIQVTYNGVTQPMSNEPFLVNGSVYVPLAAVGNIFGATPNWIPTSNTVALTGGNVGSSVDQTQLTQLSQQVQSLTAQLASKNIELNEVKAELAKYTSSNNSTSSSNGSFTTTSGTNITAAQLRETENYLNQNYTNDLSNKVPVSFSLKQYGNKLIVEMSYDSRSAHNAYKKLSQDTIKNFMRKIGDNIAASHSDIELTGRILYSTDEQASFTRTRTGSYSYNYAVYDSTIEDIVNDELNGTFKFNYNSLPSLSVSNVSVDIKESRSKITVVIKTSTSSDFTKAWGTRSSKTSLSESDRIADVRYKLEDVQEEILDSASGYDIIVRLDYDTTTIAEIDEDGRITTNLI